MLSNLLADVNQFLPTPSHGGRLTKWLSRPRNMNFYPRPHMEGDLVSVKSNLVKNISTHALTWRATVFVITNTIFPQDFYPRPHMEGDKNPGRSVPPGSDFYPRPHMEGDFGGQRRKQEPVHFYPRPHMEGDIFCKVCLQLIGQFLPTPSHGGRPLLLPDQHRHVLISTHALTWRATEADGFACAIVGISTHALTWRATGTQPHFSPPVRISPHALTWRATS